MYTFSLVAYNRIKISSYPFPFAWVDEKLQFQRIKYKLIFQNRILNILENK